MRFLRSSGESTARCNRMVPAQTAQVHDEAREHAFRLLPQLTRMHGPKETVCPQCQGELRIANNARSRFTSHNRASKIPVFAEAVREYTVSARNSIPFKKGT